MDSEAFADTAEGARAFMYEKVAMLCEAATTAEVTQAVLLGSLGAVLDVWVALLPPAVGRGEFTRAVCAAVQDLAMQAFSQGPTDA